MLDKQFNLEGRNILITGAAGFLGSAIRKSLPSCNLFSVDVSELRDQFGFSDVDELDITDCSKIQDYINDHKWFFSKPEGKIHGIINCAAISIKGKNTSLKDFNRMLDVNINGTNNIITKFLQYLSNDASIVNISSIYGTLSPDFRIYENNEQEYNPIGYGASKGAINQLTKYYAVHLAPIRVNAVSPGGILQNQTKSFVDNYSNRVPLGRMANVNEIVNAILFLLSPFSSYITGINLPVSGGLEIW